jgi:hypothetical protein
MAARAKHVERRHTFSLRWCISVSEAWRGRRREPHALAEAQQIVAEMNGSKFSWWHDHLLFLIVLEEVLNELGSHQGIT